MRVPLLVVALVGCGNSSGTPLDAGGPDAFEFRDACTDLACFQVDCASKGLPTTTVSGTVYAPNGTLKLYGVDVYVPASDPGPLAEGVQCRTCAEPLQGGAVAATKTDENGRFVLENVPATADVPLVIQIGKWRRQLTLPNVAACQELPLPDADVRLPRDSSEGDLPQIAMSTGGADALECLIYRLGIAPTEFTAPSAAGRVHMYSNTGNPAPSGGAGQGTDRFNSTWPGGASAMFGDSQTLWSSTANLNPYDIVVLSCEGSHYPDTKPQSAFDAMRAYADGGGRIFMSHWHNLWIGGATNRSTAEWASVATWNYGAAQDESTQLAIVDTTVPKGPSFAKWLFHNGVAEAPSGSMTATELTISVPRYTCQANDPAKSERWIYVDPLRSTPAGKVSVQDLLFTTPQSALPEQRCGKVVFSDMHVSSGSRSGAGAEGASSAYPFPNGCSTGELTPQEKALAFIFFDISSCAGPIL